MGDNFSDEETRGIIPRSTEHVFTHIQQQIARGQQQYGAKTQFQIRASYLQIYNEIVTDLLKPTTSVNGAGAAPSAPKQLVIRQAKNRVYVDGLSEWVVRNPHEIYGLMERGFSMRAIGATRLSELSSRSHAIFIIIVETIEGESVDSPTSFRVGKLNIVDLAGSEKVRQSGVTGVRLEETKKINWSLHELGNVISALTDPTRKDRHIPYRNSKLTHLLTDSLGGNCRTTLIACISPALESYSESLSTLKFANRAKNIKNDAIVNDDVTDPRALAVKYERELKRLRQMLAERNGGVMPPGVLDFESGLPPRGMLLQQQGGATPLEDRDRNNMLLSGDDKRHAWRLQERVRDLESMLHTQGIVVHPDGSISKNGAGGDGGNNNNGNTAAENEEDKAQVERYKQLLLKQRDIMLNLTTRLNERDESILRLQEEIDAYDGHVQQLEDQLAMMQQNNNNNSPSFNGGMNGNNNNDAAHHFAPEEADQFVAARRVTTRDGSVRFLSEQSLNLPPGQQPQLLAAEAKIRELLVTGVVPTNHELSPDAVSAAMRERLDSAVRNVLRGKVFALQHELEQARESQRQLEQRLHIAEAAAQSASGSNNNFEHVKQNLRAVIDAATQMKLQRALDELQRERAEKVQHATELERVTTEVALMQQRMERSGVGRKHPELLEEFNSSVARISGMLRGTEQALIQDAGTWLVAAAASSNNNGNNSGSNSLNSTQNGAQQQQYQEQIAALQATIDGLRRQQQQQSAARDKAQQHSAREAELQAVIEERTRAYRQLENEYRQVQQQQQAASSEAQALRRQLATHTKDRKALRTILDSRIKVKVDNVLQALSGKNSENNNSSGGVVDNKYVRQELTALQNLVNASISAMDADNP